MNKLYCGEEVLLYFPLIGVPFAFCSLSPLYDASIDVSNYYNSSDHSDINNNTGLPYGFFHFPMEGLQDGYPLVVSSGISEKRAHETLQFLEYGGLLNRDATESLALKVRGDQI